MAGAVRRIVAPAAVALVAVVALLLPGTRAADVGSLVREADALADSPEATLETLERAVRLYEEAARIAPGNAAIHAGLAEAALSAGDAAGEDALRWYELGQAAAARAVALDPGLAHAHFLLAATRGKAARLRPILEVSPRIVGELEAHLARALELDPRHARALHMMGMLLRDTPFFLRGFLDGRKRDAGRYLEAAVAAAPHFAQARLDLAEHYRDTGRPAEARAQAEAVLAMPEAVRGRRWREQYRPAAEALLRSLSGR